MTTTTTSPTVKISEFNPDNVVYQDPIINKKNQPAIYIQYKYADGRIGPLRIQTDFYNVNFGISAMEGEKSSKVGPTVTTKDSIQFEIEKTNPSIQKIEAIDKKIIEIGKTNPFQFFSKKNLNETVLNAMVEENFKPSIKYAKDDKYNPLFKGNLYKNERGVYNHKFYKKGSRTPVDVTVNNWEQIVPKRSSVMSIMKCSGAWFISGKFGISWVPEQLVVQANSSQLAEFAFDVDPTYDQEQIETGMESVSLEDPVETVELEEDESEEELEDPLEQQVERPVVSEPVTQETPVKKGGRRTKVA
jgi:hypothetical protein